MVTTVPLHEHLLAMALSGCEDLWLCGVSEGFVSQCLALLQHSAILVA